jgi:phosphoglycerate dehydrogenase-like enzyme
MRTGVKLLIYEKSLERVGARLGQVAPGVVPLVLREDGSLWADGKPVPEDAAAPEIGWASLDLLNEGPVREFMVAMLKSPAARWVQSASAGVDHPVFRMLFDKGVVVTNSDATAVAVAEFVMARVLEVFHGGDVRLRAQAAREWRRIPFREIAGTRWLVLGVGSIGREVAVRARAFAAQVVGVRRHPEGDEPVDEIVSLADLHTVLPRADVVVVSLPLNRDTAGLVGEAFLADMAPGSILVNVARGALVDEAALVAALDRGAPELAILDVFQEEPLSADSPLWSHSRVRVSAHCAPASDGTLHRADALFLGNLARYAGGEPLLSVVQEADLAG